MGRKIEIKKIEDITKCQVTFSKRRSSLMKKAQEISVCCDVDVAFIAFSPSGRISKFCNKRSFAAIFSGFVALAENIYVTCACRRSSRSCGDLTTLRVTAASHTI
ncbi:hypothetical protein RJ639_024589 [Escallonia herrerae]|uniref:MADS-box domain-containing protein n=1 Tax=Escallonia herrerae TaxID=1293975 RepID=A0AA88UZI9_9ASTE|nr:hypothetical protein RJ639_024589 [Escallonia herrerae]